MFLQQEAPSRLAKLRIGVDAPEPVFMQPDAKTVKFEEADGLPAAFELARRACLSNARPAADELELLGDGEKRIATFDDSTSARAEQRFHFMDLAFRDYWIFGGEDHANRDAGSRAVVRPVFVLMFRIVHPVSGR